MPSHLRLSSHLREVTDLMVLLAPGMSRSAVPALGLESDIAFHDLVTPMPPPRERDAVLLVVHDLASLRHAVTGLGNFGAARRIGVWVEGETSWFPSVTARPEWPPLDEVVASGSPERFVLLTFSAPTQVRPVLTHIARAGSPGRFRPPGWPNIGAPRDRPSLWPAADPAATIAMPGRLFDGSVDSPPDLVLTEASTDVPGSFTENLHPVLGRAPAVTRVEPDLDWESLAGLSEEEVLGELGRRGPLSLGPVDEHVVNPVGFDRDPVGKAVPLGCGAGHTLRADAPGCPVVLDPGRGVGDADLPALRALPGLELDWDGGRGPQAYCRVVAGLAMAGVPLVTDAVPAWAQRLLDPELVDALSGPTDLTDALAREEHSVRLRRAALRSHASRPWRATLARANGLQETADPRVSVLLVTRRPEMVAFALRQVARQRGVDLEVVLGAHGFEPDPADTEAFRQACDIPLTTFTADASALFGDVLNMAAERASGDVLLKMDDDDWYSPDFASDLLLARHYSGAEIVGCPAEFTFLEPLWLTTRRPDSTEVYRPFVAGGTIMVDRGAFRSLGGFRRTRKYVDANLLSALRDAGGNVYRTHGLGYVLRRGTTGHTWDPGLGYFVRRKSASEQWRGFRPSALLETSARDVPAKPKDERLSS